MIRKTRQIFSAVYIYALKGFDKEASSTALGIHKNTLVYRLSRITELFHVNFTDRRTRLNLLLICCLWSFSREMGKAWMVDWDKILQ